MIANKLKIDGTEYDLPSGASAVVDGNNLIINNGNINNLKSSQLVTETMTVTTNAYGWVYFPENLLVITASVTDIYKHLVLDRYERPNGYQYIASTYLETNSNATYTKLASNKTYDVTYTYLKDVPINAGHNYSTEEKIVGTWIDGKTVYEKTYLIEQSFSNGINQFLTIDSINIISIHNIALYDGKYNHHWYSQMASDVYLNILYGADANGGNGTGIYTEIASAYQNGRITKVRFTIQYTKTTD